MADLVVRLKLNAPVELDFSDRLTDTIVYILLKRVR